MAKDPLIIEFPLDGPLVFNAKGMDNHMIIEMGGLTRTITMDEARKIIEFLKKEVRKKDYWNERN